MRFAQSLTATEPPPLTPLMARAEALRKTGRDVRVLAQAMVDYPPPTVFTASLAEALTRGESALHRYAPDPGIPELRAALRDYLHRAFGLSADPGTEILVSPGANHAAFMALTALLEPGDEAVLLTPWYFNHAMTVTMVGARVRSVPVAPDEGFVPPVSRILQAWTPRTRVLVLVTPNNPTGACYREAWLRELAAALDHDERWRGVWIITDQTYQEITFTGDRPCSLATLPGMRERTITIGSFSKSLALAGWRLGFLAGSQTLVEQVLKIQDSSVICAPYASQWALARTLSDPRLEAYLSDKRALLRARRDALLAPLLDEAALEVFVPEGACFVFLGLPPGTDGNRFAWQLLEERGVAVVPGAPFGSDWSRYLRLSFGSGADRDLSEASARLVEQLRETRV